MFWLASGILTALAVLSVLLPLLRPSRLIGEGEADVAFYRAQIAELDADTKNGRIDPGEAEIARAQAARRLLALGLAAPASMSAQSTGARRLAAVLAITAIPAVAFGLYSRTGKPNLPDQPLEARLQQDPAQVAADDSVVTEIERRLAEHPDDGRDFERLAPIYQRLGRWDDAVHAREEALRLLGETALRHAAIGEAMIEAREGVVTIEANAHFERALALDPKLLEARYYIGLGAAQDGDKAKARSIWTALAIDTPADSPVKAALEQQLAILNAPAAK
jgi:cytochrome c-type biogenesis protein CcmH